jgi:hypothetical protein
MHFKNIMKEKEQKKNEWNVFISKQKYWTFLSFLYV